MKKLFLSLSLIVLAFWGCQKEQFVEPQKTEQTNVVSNSFRTYSTPAQELFNRWDSLGCSASEPDKVKYSEVIDYLISTKQWDKTDAIFKFDVHSKQAALVNWKNPQHLAVIYNDYANSFTEYVGFKGNGTNFRINTGCNFSLSGYNFTSDSSALGICFGSSDNISSKVDLSGEVATNNGVRFQCLAQANPRKDNFVLNYSGGSTNKNNTQVYGWHQATRIGNTVTYYKNGQNTVNNSYTQTAISPVNADIYLFCRNVNGTFSSYSSKVISGVYFGGNLNHKEMINGLNIHSSYVNSIPDNALLIDGNSFIAAGYIADRYYKTRVSSYQIVDYTNGKGGIKLSEMIANFDKMNKIDLSIYQNKVLFICEVTNTMATNGSNVQTTYSDLVSLCSLYRASYGNDLKILVATCLPRNGNAWIIDSKRQNPNDLYDTTTINGLIRTNYTLFADDIVDWGADTLMGRENDCDNSYYYATDKVHPNTTNGYPRLTDIWVVPKFNYYLN